MKYFVFAVALLASTAWAGEPWELEIPSLEEQVEQAQLAQLDQVVEIARTDPEYAGMLFEVKYKGQLYKAVDRRGEPQRSPGNPPARNDRMLSFLNGLSAEARAQVQVQVNITYNKDGTVANENWVLSFNANWQAQSGMNDAHGKNHK